MSNKSNNRSHLITWEVPLNQFYVDRNGLYQPKPALLSQVATITTQHLLLRWQLSCEQGQADAAVYLYHRTPNVPNQGVEYTVFAASKRGSSVELTNHVRKALNALAASRRPQDGKSLVDPDSAAAQQNQKKHETKSSFLCLPTGGLCSSSGGGKASGGSGSGLAAERLVWPGDKVKIRCIVELNEDVWNPLRILNEQINGAKIGHPTRQQAGLLGEQLWRQVAHLKPNDTVPNTTDLVLVCPKGERIAAHKAVVAGFSRLILDEVKNGPRGLLLMHVSGVGPAAVWEVLHFIYLRHLSRMFHRAPLNEILEADRLFGLPEIAKLEVEKVFAQILDAENRERMDVLANKYGLVILQNMTRKAEQDALDANAGGTLKESGIVTDEEKAAVCVMDD